MGVVLRTRLLKNLSSFPISGEVVGVFIPNQSDLLPLFLYNNKVV